MKRDKVLRDITTLTPERLRQLVSYDSNTGIFTRLVTTRNAPLGTTTKGSLNPDGYLGLSVAGKQYLAHRLAWMYVYGVWPPHHTDHIDGNKANNSINNLRCATASQNVSSRHQLDKRNSSGISGVYWSSVRRKLVAQICVNRKVINLGGYGDKETAALVRRQAEQQYHGEFSRQHGA